MESKSYLSDDLSNHGSGLRELPAGLWLAVALQGHSRTIGRIAWSPNGRFIASPSRGEGVKIWSYKQEKEVSALPVLGDVFSVAWSPDGTRLAWAGAEPGLFIEHWSYSQRFSPREPAHRRGILGTLGRYNISPYLSIRWSPRGNLIGVPTRSGLVVLDSISLEEIEFFESDNPAFCWSPDGDLLAYVANDRVNIHSSSMLSSPIGVLRGLRGPLYDLTWTSRGKPGLIAGGGEGKTIYVWDLHNTARALELEGHTANLESLSFSADGRLLASRANVPDGTVRLWRCDTWEQIASIAEGASGVWPSGIAFHPSLPLLATLSDNDHTINVWNVDWNALKNTVGTGHRDIAPVYHSTAKIVLVGDSGVGKTGLGWRLAHAQFKEHSSTHGQQFWVLDQLATQGSDGTQCEAILWDLAGQPDYRLIHALFLDDADLALIVFDPTDDRDPLHGVQFWLQQLRFSGVPRDVNDVSKSDMQGQPRAIILVGARCDRGESRLIISELQEYCRQNGISGGYIATSAKDNEGIDILIDRMRREITWEAKTATVTTTTFKRIKDYVLSLKEKRKRRNVIVKPKELRAKLEKTDKHWVFSDAEMMTAVSHLANYGYVRILRTSQGDERILLTPELLNNLAASFVLEARRNVKGLGSLEERRLIEGGYRFPELDRLSSEEKEILLDSAALLFLAHNVCFRETDPLSDRSYLVFPELINLKRPNISDEPPTVDGPSYTVTGSVENVYASLVVLLGYTQTFTRTDQWRNQARYIVGDHLICGFRQEEEREGELDLVLYFGKDVGAPVRILFQGLFESFLARRKVQVFRYEPVICSKGHMLNRVVVREHAKSSNYVSFCSQCGEKLLLPKAEDPIQLSVSERQTVEVQQWFAATRSRFEQAVFQLTTYVEAQSLSRPTCFISYAWGDLDHERWVERNLATDLQKAGVNVLLDRWENARVGSSISRFIERIADADAIIVVGTSQYREKYSNTNPEDGYVVAAEGDLITRRMRGTEEQKESVLPVLVSGDEATSFPPLLRGRVFADFRNERGYFSAAFDLILSVFRIPFNSPAVADLRASLAASAPLNSGLSPQSNRS